MLLTNGQTSYLRMKEGFGSFSEQGRTVNSVICLRLLQRKAFPNKGSGFFLGLRSPCESMLRRYFAD